MSVELIGTVEAKNENGVKVQGKWYNFSKYSEANFSAIEKGKTYKFIIVNEKFIKQFEEQDSNGSQPQQTVESSQQPVTTQDNNVWEEKDKRISRMNCITNAVNILTHNKKDEKILVEEVLMLADILLNYVYTGEVPKISRNKKSSAKSS